MSVEMNGLSVGGCLFEMVIWADCFVVFERDFLGKMVGTDVVMKVVVEVVEVEAVDVVHAGFFVFFRRGCLENMMGVRVTVEVGVGVVKVLCGLRMGVGVGGVGNRGEGMMSSGGNVSVADGGGARWKDCCKVPDGIFEEL